MGAAGAAGEARGGRGRRGRRGRQEKRGQRGHHGGESKAAGDGGHWDMVGTGAWAGRRGRKDNMDVLPQSPRSLLRVFSFLTPTQAAAQGARKKIKTFITSPLTLGSRISERCNTHAWPVMGTITDSKCIAHYYTECIVSIWPVAWA